jgi:uncharacterized repeat protein (TIGR03843 family)
MTGGNSFGELSPGETLELLRTAEIDGLGLHPEGSNYVFIVRLQPDGDGEPVLAVYKPAAGERPLRDFPRGTLYRRETAAYELGTALRWPRIPPTVIRDGPHGIGSVQLFIDGQPNANYFSMRDDQMDRFEAIALFDIIANNADRKGGAVLLDDDDRLWAIDHGLTFNPLARLRTVMLEFCGEPISDALVDDLRALGPSLGAGATLGERLRELLADEEVEQLQARVEYVVGHPVFPMLDPDRNVPWPFL